MRFIFLFIFGGSICYANIADILPDWKFPPTQDSWLVTGIFSLQDGVEEAPVLAPLFVEDLSSSPTLEREVPQEFIDFYFEKKPEHFLLDPQSLLAAEAKKEITGILNFHASSSEIDLFVTIFSSDQWIPSDVREQEWMERLFSQGRPACMVTYYLGDPKRSSLHLSPKLFQNISLSEIRQASDSAKMIAIGKAHPSQQLIAFLEQISVRLYLMDEGHDELPQTRLDLSKKKTKQEKRSLNEMLTEQFPRLEMYEEPFLWASAVLLGVFVLFFFGLLKRKYRFPDCNLEPRLRGDKGAGIGATIRFASPNIPPSEQKRLR